MDLNVKQLNFRIGLIILILSGYAYVIIGQVQERFFFALSVIVLAAGICQYSTILHIRKNILDILQIIFVFLLLICGVVYASITPIVYGIAMGVFYIISTDLMRRNAIEKTYTHDIYITNVVVSVLVISISLLFYPISYTNYSGIFSNPNSMGIFAVTLETVIVANILKKACLGNRQSFFEIMIWSVSVFVIVISSCRTAVVALALQIAAAFILFLIKSSLNRKKLLKIALFPIAVLVLFFVLQKMGFLDILYHSMIEKFNIIAQSGDSTNGRTGMWIDVLQNSSWLHDGSLTIDVVSHNVYLGLMNEFGRLPAIVYALFVLLYCIKAGINTLRQKKDNCCFLPLMAAINFAVISMTENYLMTSSMLLMYMTMEMDTIMKKNSYVDVVDDSNDNKIYDGSDESDVEKINEEVKSLAYFKF